MDTDETQVVVPVEIREITRIETPSGFLHIIHEISLGDLLVSTFLAALIIFLLISRVVRR